VAVPHPAGTPEQYLAVRCAARPLANCLPPHRRNEMSAIDACGAYVAAQKEYAEKGFAGKGVYARRFISRPGERDGLYWPAPSGENESPLGEFATSAAEKGYPSKAGGKLPIRATTTGFSPSKGPNAPGGEVDYMVSGNMVGGFALVAYPAHTACSGLMTFLVQSSGNHLREGPRLAHHRYRLGHDELFDPDRTWRRVKPAVGFPIAPP